MEKREEDVEVVEKVVEKMKLRGEDGSRRGRGGNKV